MLVQVHYYYGSHIFRIFIFREIRRKKGHFSRKTKKKIIPMKKGQNCIQLNKCYKFFNRLTGKISTQEFSSSFYHFLCWRQCGALEIYQKCPTKSQKLVKNERKSIFHFSSSHFSRKFEKYAKNFFLWDP